MQTLVASQLESYIPFQSIWGVPSAFASLMQLATAQAKPGELPKLIATEYRTQGEWSPCISRSLLAREGYIHYLPSEILKLNVCTGFLARCDTAYNDTL